MDKLPINFNSRSLDDLVPEFQEKIQQMIENVAARGIKIVPYSTLRSPLIQAQNYCIGRTDTQILNIIRTFQNLGCENLRVIMQFALSTRKKTTIKQKIITNALPGQSWHNWGEAVDCYVENPPGKADWNHPEGYKIMQEEAEKLGLTSGGSFKRLVEPVHTQLRPGSPPASWYQFDQILAKRFDFSSFPSVQSSKSAKHEI
jgi:hypothetical protein